MSTNNRETIFKGNSRQLFCAVVDSDGIFDLATFSAKFYAQKYPPTDEITQLYGAGTPV